MKKLEIDNQTAAKLLRWAALGAMLLAEKLDPTKPPAKKPPTRRARPRNAEKQ